MPCQAGTSPGQEDGAEEGCDAGPREEETDLN